ncbi:MAG TPA: ATP-binding protein [Acidimicrobiia bacterium]|nr:ATP-binding protein [Acidimicrobiia bacterium]
MRQAGHGGPPASGGKDTVITERTGRRALSSDEAAEYLGIPVAALDALVARDFLKPLEQAADGPRFAVSDLKGFMARNAPDEDLFAEEMSADPRALLDALDGRAEEMAMRAFEIFKATFPEAVDWPLDEQARFVDQARKRFEAILAVTGQGEDVDTALVADLEAVGAGAAWSQSPLPQLLVVLRISRDLVVQTAVEIAEERGRHWGLALSLLLTRVLPSIDRLTDALARGYWIAILGREEELRERMESLLEHSSDGVYEVDLDGRLTYANPSFAAIAGRSLDQLEGTPLSEVLLAAPGKVEALMSEPGIDEADGDSRRIDLELVRPDGVGRHVTVTTFPRRSEGMVVGYQGIVRDVTAVRELERAKNDFIALITNDLRSPLASILGHGVTLQAYGEDLSVARLRSIGRSIHRQAERMSRLADDLHDVAQLENQTLTLNLRTVELLEVVDNSVATVPEPFRVDVEVPEGLEVVADVRRLEQVVANLVENGLRHGEPPVRVTARREGAQVRMDVTDTGRGVPDAVVPTLFSSLRTVSRHDRDRDGGTGLGLFLVKGLIEGMGGRVAYEPSPEGGARFSVWVPAVAVRD